MAIHNRAGQPAQQSDLINVAQLTAQYYVLKPEAGNAEHAVKFGTSGHRGSAARHSFNEPHILAIAQAIAEERAKNGITGPCYVGKDTHALSEPAFISVLEVLAANGVDVIVQENNGFTPTPAISNAILVHNKKGGPLADGIVITPSHNPPEDGGIKYNPPNGGPADTNVTKVVEDRANALLADGLKGVKRISLDEAMASGHVKEQDLVQPFVEGLADIVDMAAIQKAGLTLGVDPMGGSGIEYWKRIGEYYNLNLTIVNDQVDQTFRFMHLDKDGAIRMDCSSECAMAGLLALRDKFDLAFANDPDYDRHGIVTPAGLMNPNHYLAVAINYLFPHRPQWGKDVAVASVRRVDDERETSGDAKMNEQLCQRIENSAHFRELVASRQRFAAILSVIMLVIYVGFILLIAFAPGWLGTPLHAGTSVTRGIPLGIGVIVISFILTGIYVWRANGEFDRLTKSVLNEVKA